MCSSACSLLACLLSSISPRALSHVLKTAWSSLPAPAPAAPPPPVQTSLSVLALGATGTDDARNPKPAGVHSLASNESPPAWRSGGAHALMTRAAIPEACLASRTETRTTLASTCVQYLFVIRFLFPTRRIILCHSLFYRTLYHFHRGAPAGLGQVNAGECRCFVTHQASGTRVLVSPGAQGQKRTTHCTNLPLCGLVHHLDRLLDPHDM